MQLIQRQLSISQRNIFAFGGDPTRITLAGQDSGAVSALFLLDLMNPDGAGPGEPQLFHRVIVQSAGIQVGSSGLRRPEMSFDVIYTRGHSDYRLGRLCDFVILIDLKF